MDRALPAARGAGDLQVLVPALAVSAMVAAATGNRGEAAGHVREVESVTQVGAMAYRARYLPELVAIGVEVRRPNGYPQKTLLATEYRDTGRIGHAAVAARAVWAEARGEAAEALALYERIPLPAGTTTALCPVEQSRSSAPGVAYSHSDERAKLRFDCAKRASSCPSSARSPQLHRVDDALAHATSVSA